MGLVVVLKGYRDRKPVRGRFLVVGSAARLSVAIAALGALRRPRG